MATQVKTYLLEQRADVFWDKISLSSDSTIAYAECSGMCKADSAWRLATPGSWIAVGCIGEKGL